MKKLVMAFITAEARDLGNKLIFEFGITRHDDLADFLKVNSSLNGQRAVRAWAQTQLSLLDSDETEYERYRQLRRLFQPNITRFYIRGERMRIHLVSNSMLNSRSLQMCQRLLETISIYAVNAI